MRTKDIQYQKSHAVMSATETKSRKKTLVAQVKASEDTLHFNWSTKGSVKNKQERATRISEAVKHNCIEIEEACMQV